MDDDLKRYLDAIQEQNAAAHAETRRHFDESVEATRREFEVSTDTLTRHFDQSVEATRREFEVSTDTLTRHFDESVEATRREFEVSTATLKRHFDVSTEEVKGQIQLIAEIVAHLNERIDATNANVERIVERTAAETQAMIKFSHAELDRRVRTLETKHHTLEERHRTLEESFAELQTRVDRLESSPH